MGRVLVFAVLLFSSTVAVQAHPGHDHSQDTHEVLLTHQTVEDPVALSSAVSLSFLILVACLVVSVVLVFDKASRRSILIPLFIALLGVLASLACTEAQAAPPQPKHNVAEMEKLFAHFKTDGIKTRNDETHFFIESNSFPNHPMMKGIKSWQQQVPLPQPYSGRNAWQIPLTPVVAEQPISARKALFRGAIAVAVNGVPIFNALNNRGDDAFLAGELDEYGGHCGRGDDYHYHIAPVHLEKTVGKGKPIGYALDGFPLYGYTDANGNEPKNLDEFNGRYEADGSYRYYSTKKYPYINGGLRGVVTVKGDQVEPQPKDSPIRPAGQPLRGATITDFERDDKNQTYTLKYSLQGGSYAIRYTINKDNTFKFVYIDSRGQERSEVYTRKERKK